MNKEAQSPNGTPEPTRREFLKNSVWGASLFGLGGALGVLPADLRAEKPKSAPLGGRKLGKEFTYDIGPLRNIDPQLIRYAQTAKFAAGFKSATAIAVEGGQRILIAGDQAIRIFDLSGKRLQEFALAMSPRCLGIGADKSIYAGAQDHVEVLNEQGQLKARWESLGAKAVITAIAAAERDVFVADAGNRVVWHYDPAGKLQSAIGRKEPGKAAQRFIVPSAFFDLSIGPDGLLWVVNPGEHQLQAFTFQGDLEYTWGETSTAVPGFCGCCNPVHFAFLPDGRFVTSEKGIPRIKVYSPKGQFECVVAGPESFPKLFDNPNAKMAGIEVAVDAQNRVLALDPFSGEVLIFSRKAKEA